MQAMPRPQSRATTSADDLDRKLHTAKTHLGIPQCPISTERQVRSSYRAEQDRRCRKIKIWSLGGEVRFNDLQLLSREELPFALVVLNGRWR